MILNNILLTNGVTLKDAEPSKLYCSFGQLRSEDLFCEESLSARLDMNERKMNIRLLLCCFHFHFLRCCAFLVVIGLGFGITGVSSFREQVLRCAGEQLA
jgi:hypothetical protein